MEYIFNLNFHAFQTPLALGFTFNSFSEVHISTKLTDGAKHTVLFM